jgi:hypothetical protein
MTLEEFEDAQMEDSDHAWPELISRCIRRFRMAGDLVGACQGL